MEPRARAKENAQQDGTPRTPSRQGASHGLERVRQTARLKKEERFTALLHHVDGDQLREAYFALKREAAPGVDGVTWEDYGHDLEVRLEDLHGRVHRGAYRAQPSRRRYLPKPDGRQRPLGIAALEDKIVQRALVEVLNAIYEEDFLGFSYGFRPGRGQHVNRRRKGTPHRHGKRTPLDHRERFIPGVHRGDPRVATRPPRGWRSVARGVPVGPRG